MEDVSPDVKKARVKELEQIVRKLEQENKQLLNKVRTGSPTLQHRQLATAELEKLDVTSDDNREKEYDENLLSTVLDLDDMNVGSQSEGEWLFMSPKLVLTPVQKKQTPKQWLSEGHNQRIGDEDIPSLDEVRKTLVFNMEEAETLSKAAYPRPNPSNKTAQRYLSRVRERSDSNSPPPLPQYEDEPSNSIPVVNWKSTRPNTEAQSVPIVRWKARMPPADSPTLSEEEVEEIPVGKWKVKQVPSEPEVIPKVAWDPNNAASFDDVSDDEEFVNNETVPVVKWKAKVPQEEDRDVPVVKWKAKVPQEGDGDVPVVKWKAKVPQEGDGDVPVVKWKAKVPQGGDGDVPVVKWKAKVPQGGDGDVPVVKWTAKVPQDSSENVPVKWKAQNPTGSPGRGRATQRRGGLMRPGAVRRTEATPTNSYDETQRGDSELSGAYDSEQRNLRAPQNSGLRRPQNSTSPSQSPTTFQSRLGAGKGLRKPRTASPGQSQSVRSRSPSPSALHTQTSSLSPAGRRQLARPTATSSPSQRTPSPGRSNLAQPGGSPKMPRSQLQAVSPGRHSSGLPHSSKTGVQDNGQRMSRLQTHRESRESQKPSPSSQNSLKPSNSSRTPGSSGLQGPSSLGSGKRGLTPPRGGGNSKPRRMLPTPPSANSRASTQRPVQQQHQQKQQPQDVEGDSWLEGCF